MTSGSYDFTGYEVLVIGGTRGEGHTIASAFARSGANVTVTGTMMLRALYDTDLAAFDYESVNLARQESIDNLVGIIGHLDVLVLAASCNLPFGLPADERAFIAEAARSGLLGPTFLTTRMRLKLGQSPAPGGGCVINTGAVSVSTAVGQVLALAAAPEFQPTEGSQRLLADRALDARVRAVMKATPATAPLDLDIHSEAGHVRLAGVVGSDAARDSAVAVAREVEGVLQVSSEMKVFRRPVR